MIESAREESNMIQEYDPDDEDNKDMKKCLKLYKNMEFWESNSALHKNIIFTYNLFYQRCR